MKAKYTVWIHGSVMGSAGWLEHKVLDVLEGFTTVSEAHRAARKRMREQHSGQSASHYKIGPAY